jgi:hypothetical protein
MYINQSFIGTSIENPVWNKCSGDVLVMPVGALVTSRHFYISETCNPLVRWGLAISPQTTSITIQVQGTVDDNLWNSPQLMDNELSQY